MSKVHHIDCGLRWGKNECTCHVRLLPKEKTAKEMNSELISARKLLAEVISKTYDPSLRKRAAEWIRQYENK